MLLIYAIMVFLFLVITGLPVRPFHSLPVFPSNLATLKDFKEEIPAKFLEYELPPRISSETVEELVILHLLFFYKFIYLFILFFVLVYLSEFLRFLGANFACQSCLGIR